MTVIPRPDELPRRIVEFVDALRRNGMRVSTSEAIDAARAAMIASSLDLEVFRLSLRATLAKRSEDLLLFDELFAKYWMNVTHWELPRPRTAVRIVYDEPPGDPVSHFLGVYSPLDVYWEGLSIEEPHPDAVKRYKVGVRSLVRAASLKEGRRKTRLKSGDMDFRKIMKRSLKAFGEPYWLVKSGRRRTKSRLVLVADVSNSMKDYWVELYALLSSLKSLPSGSYEVFLFSTRLFRATEILQSSRSALDFLRRTQEHVGLWGSGTRIGDSLAVLAERYSGILSSRAILVIVSDGWDLGDLDKLREVLRAIRRMVGLVIWVVPGRVPEADRPAGLDVALEESHTVMTLESLKDPRLVKRAVYFVK
ncbi:MAG: VWA domain-containing protein [Aeropyrum sp.]|nr:VWA domain-containing protein [Aeropyrum sp.]